EHARCPRRPRRRATWPVDEPASTNGVDEWSRRPGSTRTGHAARSGDEVTRRGVVSEAGLEGAAELEGRGTIAGIEGRGGAEQLRQRRGVSLHALRIFQGQLLHVGEDAVPR